MPQGQPDGAGWLRLARRERRRSRSARSSMPECPQLQQQQQHRRAPLGASRPRVLGRKGDGSLALAARWAWLTAMLALASAQLSLRTEPPRSTTRDVGQDLGWAAFKAQVDGAGTWRASGRRPAHSRWAGAVRALFAARALVPLRSGGGAGDWRRADAAQRYGLHHGARARARLLDTAARRARVGLARHGAHVLQRARRSPAVG